MKSIFKVMTLAVACLLISSVVFAQIETFVVEEGAAPGGTTYPDLATAVATASTFPGGPHKVMIMAGNYTDAGLSYSNIDEIYGDPAGEPGDVVFTGDGSTFFLNLASGTAVHNMTVTGYTDALRFNGVTLSSAYDMVFEANGRGAVIFNTADDNAVYDSYFINNTSYGVQLVFPVGLPNGNAIHDNCFLGNTGYDNAGAPNTWSDNYWYDDVAGTSAYVLAGGIGATDNNPWRRENVVVGPAAAEVYDPVHIDMTWTAPPCADGVLLAAYEFTVSYSPTHLQFVGAAYDEAYLGTGGDGALYTGIAVDEVAGTITFAATNFDLPGEGDGILASLDFTAIGLGTPAITVGSVYLDELTNPIPYAGSSLTVTITDDTDPEITVAVDDPVGDDTFSDNYDLVISGDVTDNFCLYVVQYRFDDAGGWNLVSNVSGTADSYGPFTVPMTGLSEGAHVLNLRVADCSPYLFGYVDYAFTVDKTGPDPSGVTIVDSDGCADAGFTSSELCDVSWTDDGTAVEMELALTGFPVPFVAYENATTYTFPSTEATYTLHVRLKDAYGNAGAYSAGTSITLDMTAPAPSAAYTVPAGTTGSATFDGDCNLDAAGGALYAKAVMGAVAPDCGDIVDLISGLGAAPRFAFEIDPPVDGTYDVTFASRDAAGNVGFVSTTIDLDLTPTEIDAISVVDATGSECSDNWTVSVTVEWTGNDVADLLLGTATGVYGAPIDISAETSPFTTLYTIVGGTCDDFNTVFAVIEDGVANQSAEVSDDVFVDCAAPVAGTVVLNGTSSTWSANPVVSVDLSGWSADVDEIFMSLVSGDYSSAVVEPFAASTTFDFGTPIENNWVYLYVEAEDCADRRTGEVNDRVAFDLTDPVLSDVLLDGGAALTNDVTVSVSFTFTELHMQTVYISMNSDMSGATSYPWAGGPPYDFDVTAGDGTKDVYVQLEDFVGRMSTIEMSSIELDGTPPVMGTMVFTSGNPLAVEGYTNSLAGNSFAFTTPDTDIYRIQVRNADDAPSTGWLYTEPWSGALPLLDDPGLCGPITIEWYITDLAMNQAGPFTGIMEYCPTAPPAPSNATGTPGGSVALAWDAVTDAQFYHIRYNFTNDAPDYSIIPPFPGTMGEGIFEAETADPSYEFDGPQDDLYAFGIWTLSNHGVWSAGPNQEILENNYRLGDFEDVDENPGSDGCLSFDPEFVALAVSYNTQDGVDAYYDNNLDFAPTSDGSATGYAQQDGWVDFEDLVVFALNYQWSRAQSECASQKLGGGAATSVIADVTVTAEIPAFARAGEEFTVPISISEGGIAGYHLVFDFPGNIEVVSVNPGAVYDNADKMFFYYDEDAANLDISSVVLSDGFEAGEIAVVTFRATSTGMIDLEDKDLDVRDWQNEKAEVTFDLAAKGGTLPTEFSLSQNYPNPFNPTTTIELAMPVAGQYKLTIFNIIGQVVGTFEGHSEAGFITFNWDASEQSSGVYLYRVEAGSFSDVRKMVLLK